MQRLQQFSQAVLSSSRGGQQPQQQPQQDQPYGNQSYSNQPFISQGGGGGTATLQRTRLQAVPWAQIQQPGCWVDASTGDLIRIPPQAFTSGGVMLMPMVEIETTRLSSRFYHLSNDPFVPTPQARELIEQLQQVVAQQQQF